MVVCVLISYDHLHFAHILGSLMHIIDTRILISMQPLRVLQVVCRHTQRHVAEKLACTIGELCGHWDRIMYVLVPLTCMHGGSGGAVTMATTFLW